MAGNLTADPEIRFTKDGTVIAKLRVACSERKRTPEGEWVDGDTTYMNVNVWRQAGNNVAESLSKGNAVVVVGKLRSRTVEHADHGNQTYLDVDAETVSADLTRATVTPVRNVKASTNAPTTDPWVSETPF